MSTEEADEAIRERFFAASPRYVFRDRVGRGGMGIVFKAWDAELEELVAVKVLLPLRGATEDEALARFKREISLSRSLRHPNIARVYDLGTAGGLHYLTMELVEGVSLAEALESSGPLPAAEAVGVLRQIALGAGAAHEKGIVHRDLKPQNIMVEPSGAIAILDFGLAYRPAGTALTEAPACIGTPRYIAPEQARGRAVDARADVYSIGVIAFELLTGAVPFEGPDPYEVALQQVVAPVPAHRLEEARVPPALARIVRDCLAKEPDERPRSGKELEARLALLGAEGLVPRRPPPPSAELPRTRELPRNPQAPGFETAPLPVVVATVDGTRDRPSGHDTAPLAVPVPERPPVVLVADDDDDFRRFAVATLEAAGFKTVVASSGHEALSRLHDGNLDLAVLDVWMPDVDGFDVLRVHQSQNPDRVVPAVLVSASLTRAQIAYAVRLGALEVLVKPLPGELLADRVWAHVRSLETVAAG